jgi:hypothetical protein
MHQASLIVYKVFSSAGCFSKTVRTHSRGQSEARAIFFEFFTTFLSEHSTISKQSANTPNLSQDGHSFYVLTTNKGKPGSYDAYNPFGGSQPPGGPLKTLNPLKKYTISVPRKGYVVLRLEADNEGLWLFHCHIIWQ